MTDRLTQLLELLHEMPEDPFLSYGVCLEYVSLKDDTTALKHFTALQNKHPDYLALYYQLGKLFERLNKIEEAKKTYLEGIQISRKQKDMHTLRELQNALDEID